MKKHMEKHMCKIQLFCECNFAEFDEYLCIPSGGVEYTLFFSVQERTNRYLKHLYS